MSNTKAANDNAPTVKTIGLAGFGRSGQRVDVNSRHARTFRIELTFDSGFTSLMADVIPSRGVAILRLATVAKAASKLGQF